jgi:hypothetical protein
MSCTVAKKEDGPRIDSRSNIILVAAHSSSRDNDISRPSYGCSENNST